MPYCTTCGGEVGEEHSYCEHCGSDLSEIGDSEVQNGPSSEATTQTITTARELDDGELKSALQDMDNYDFEYFVAGLWKEMGWDTEVSQASVDAGIDVIATKERPYHQKKVIQAKRYSESTTVGGPDIQQYSSLKQQVPNADSVIVVTTSSFTNGAESRADELNVKLIGGDDIVAMIRDFDAYDLVDEYLEIDQSGTTSDNSATVDTSVNNPQSAGELSDTESIESTDSSKFDKWHWISAATGVITYPVTSVSGNLAFILVLVTLVSTYIDIRRVRDRSEWSPRAWLYSLGILFGLAIFALPIYLFNRYRYA